MKKLLNNSLLLVVMTMVIVTVIACGSDDEPEPPQPPVVVTPEDIGADNYTDVAVTGGISKITPTTATLLGYVNLDDNLKLLMGKTLKIGVEVSTIETMANSKRYETNSLIGNRKISVIANGLYPNTTYYYRTFVMNEGVTVNGETLNFTTNNTEVNVRIKSVSALTPLSVKVICEIPEHAENYSVSTIGVAVGLNVYSVSDYKNMSLCKLYNPKSINGNEFEVVINDLEQNTEYYFCPFNKVESVYALGDVDSLKTPSNFEYYIERAESFVLSSPTYNESGKGYALQAAFKLKYKKEGTKLHGYGISVSETKTIDEKGRLVDQFRSGMVSFVYLSCLRHICHGGYFPFMRYVYDNRYRLWFFEESTPLLVFGKKYYYQLYYNFGRSETPPYEYNSSPEIAYDEVKEIVVSNYQLPVMPANTAIDMGMGVKWRWCNLGATSPEQPGDFYVWGETSLDDTGHGQAKGEDITGTEYDVAHFQLGGNWHLPHDKDIKSLNIFTRGVFYENFEKYEDLNFDNGIPCNAVLDYDYKGVKGLLYFSYNGNVIFFPSPLYTLLIGDEKTTDKRPVRPVCD